MKYLVNKKTTCLLMIALLGGFCTLPVSEAETAKTTSSIEKALGQRLADFDREAYKKKNVSYVGGYEGQCTWYCLGRAYEKTGKLITVAPTAKKWLNIKLPKGAKVVKDKAKIRANAIAVVTNTKYGHVMYVEAVKDGFVYYTEANVPMDNKLDVKDGTVKRQKVSDFTKRVGGYIYL